MKALRSQGTLRKGIAFLGALGALILPHPAQADPLTAPNERHLNPPILSEELPKIPPPRRWPDAYEGLLVRRSPLPWWKAGKADAVLTEACRIGRFQGVDGLRLYVRFEGKEGRALLRVVPKGRHDLLADPDGLRRPEETYYFKDDGWGNCLVLYEGPKPPRVKAKR
jgi:hypothetical protein